MYRHLKIIVLIAFIGFVLSPTASAVNQTLGNWTMNEGSGIWANDTSGTNFNGSVNGSVVWTTNLVNGSVNGTALQFYGATYGNVTVDAGASVAGQSAFTVSLWFKIPSIANISNTDILYGEGNSGTNTQFLRIARNIITANDFVAQFKDDAGVMTTISIDGGFQDDKWHHAMAVKEHNSIRRLYIDDVLRGSSSTSVGATTINRVTIGGLTRVGGVEGPFNGTIDEVQNYNYALNSSERTALYQLFQPVPAYPVGGIVLAGTYPPLTTTVNFTWHDSEYPSDRLTVAEDSAFNVIVHDSYYSTDYANIALEAGKTYYWKVRQYNGTTGLFGDTSATQTFSITATPAATDGTSGINGIIYETVNGIKTPLNAVQVFIYNNSWSKTMFTGSNGYYVFSGLEGEQVYYITAKKENYDDSAIQTVNTTSAAWVSHDIPLIKCISVYCGYYNEQYVKFTLQSVFGTKYSDVAVSVYKGDEAATTYTGTTASDGSITFLLIKDQEYRLTFINASQGINREMTVIPFDTSYIVIVPIVNTPWQEHENQEMGEINITVSKSIPNATNALINVTYNDSLAQTTSLIVYINQTNASNPYNQTVIASWTATLPANSTNHSFVLFGYTGQQYLVHFVATHDEYGTIDRTYAVIFDKSASITGIPDRIWAYIAVFLMVFIGAVFTYSTSEKGLMITCGMGWIFMFLGWFDTLNKTQIAVALTVVSILAVMAYINRSNKAEGYA